MFGYSEPFAFQLYRRFRSGQSLEQLAAELAIPIERIRLRLQAAEDFWQRSGQADPSAGFGSSLAALCDRADDGG